MFREKIQRSIKQNFIVIVVIIVIIMLVLYLVLILMPKNESNDTAVSGSTPQQTDDFSEEESSVPSDQGETDESCEEETSVPSEPKETDSGRREWQVYVQPDMPEPYMEVFRQYEEFLNADNQDLNDKNVWNKINLIDGEWRYVDDELCGGWQWWSAYGKQKAEGYIRYSLTDLSGDGFPELIMGYHIDDDGTFPKVIYYYSETEGIKMEYASSYYTMTLYEGGMIEYESGGVNYTITYDQFRQDTGELAGVDKFLVETIIDGEYVPGGANYYREGDGGDFADEPIPEEDYKRITDGCLDQPVKISEEEFKRITDKYTEKPMELQWTPLIQGSETEGLT